MAKLPDTQSENDNRRVPIAHVGVRSLRYPVVVDGEATVGTFSLSVHLPAHERGTHMSRFVLLVQEFHGRISAEVLLEMAERLAKNQESKTSEIRLKFPWFAKKAAPVTGALGLLDYEVEWSARWSQDSGGAFVQKIIVPVATLCPCSKAISERGAHNQRGHLSITLESSPPVSLVEIIEIAESSASCELYSVLKRPDEKHVTERAYDRPAFVEDVVREATVHLRKLRNVIGFRVEAENFESIHNHNAFAIVEEGHMGWL